MCPYHTYVFIPILEPVKRIYNACFGAPTY